MNRRTLLAGLGLVPFAAYAADLRVAGTTTEDISGRVAEPLDQGGGLMRIVASQDGLRLETHVRAHQEGEWHNAGIVWEASAPDAIKVLSTNT